MTKNPVCCLPGDPVAKVAQLMRSTDIGSVPIVEDERSKRLVGIVTDRDLAVKMVAEGRDAETATAEEVMSRSVVTCHPQDDVETAVETMSGNQLRRLPVVDDHGKIVGIIAQADVATRVNRSDATAAMVKEISQTYPK
jgi:CBS domain-containing protein